MVIGRGGVIAVGLAVGLEPGSAMCPCWTYQRRMIWEGNFPCFLLRLVVWLPHSA